jgi:hypothetical protein
MQIIKHTNGMCVGVCVHLRVSESERGRELTAMVAVGLKATLIFMISPFDIPPCLST